MKQLLIFNQFEKKISLLYSFRNLFVTDKFLSHKIGFPTAIIQVYTKPAWLVRKHV